jgi:hypothetical protein
MDSSDSIGFETFYKMKQIVVQISKLFVFNQSDTRVSLISYSDKPTEIFNFLTFPFLSNIDSLIENVKFEGGEADTAAALKKANEEILQENKGMRPGE